MFFRLVPLIRYRRLWTAATSAHHSLPTAIRQCTDQIGQAPTSHGSSCLALISQYCQSSDIDCAASAIRQQLPGTQVIGTVVDQINHSNVPALSLLYHTGRGHSFYVGDAHGRQRLREVAVGRWHTEVTDRYNQMSDSWRPGTSSVTRRPSSNLSLPLELTEISDPQKASLVLFVADRDSRQVLDALDAKFPAATKLGIVGAQTPFINGRDFTLVKDTDTYSSGMAGFVFTSQEMSVAIDYDGGLEPISQTLRIQRCKGNVVLDIEHADAAHMVIASARGRQDKRLYARISNEGQLQHRVFRVTGGNPSKGGLAIDTLRDIPAGSYIQFMMAKTPGIGNPAVSFNGSGIATEHGFVYGAPSWGNSIDDGSIFTGSTECDVPGSSAALAF